MIDIREKNIAIFDMDGTLSESKSPMDAEMAELLEQLVGKKYVAIISGGLLGQVEKQITASIKDPELLSRFFLFPTSGTRFYKYDGSWNEVYADEMLPADRQKIKDAFLRVFAEIGYEHPKETYGELIEDRGTQVTFSAVGQQAPLEAKKQWREHHDRRREMVPLLQAWLPEFEWKIPGMSSIDVTPKGIDKAYGIAQIEKHIGIDRAGMVFVGDGLYEGGNDYPVKAAGVDCVEVSGPEDTKKVLRAWLNELV